MTLQLRRGSSADVAGIVPAVAEPIWNTETNTLSIGDGVTPGGIDISAQPPSTGDIGFQGTWIRNTGTGAIYISPQDGQTGVYMPSDDNAAGNAVEVFNTDASGLVRIAAYNKSWVFDNDGAITFPDSTIQTTAYTGGGVTEIIAGSNISINTSTGAVTISATGGGASTSTFDQIQIGTGTYKLFIGESGDGYQNQFYITGNSETDDRLFFDQFQYVQFNNTTTINNNANLYGRLTIGATTNYIQTNDLGGGDFSTDIHSNRGIGLSAGSGPVSISGQGLEVDRITNNDAGFITVADQITFEQTATVATLKFTNDAYISNTAYNDITFNVGDSAVRINGDQGLIIGDGTGSSQIDVNQITGLGGGYLNVASVLQVGDGEGSGYITSKGNNNLILQTSDNDGPGASIVLSSGAYGTVELFAGDNQETSLANFNTGTGATINLPTKINQQLTLVGGNPNTWPYAIPLIPNLYDYSGGSGTPEAIQTRVHRGTPASPASVQQGDNIFMTQSLPYTGAWADRSVFPWIEGSATEYYSFGGRINENVDQNFGDAPLYWNHLKSNFSLSSYNVPEPEHGSVEEVAYNWYFQGNTLGTFNGEIGGGWGNLASQVKLGPTKSDGLTEVLFVADAETETFTAPQIAATTATFSHIVANGNIDGSEGAIANMTGFRAGWYGGSSGYSFKNDGAQDTGMFSNADGDLRLRANSVDVVIIDDTQMRVDRINASTIYSNNTTQDLSLTAGYNGAGSGAGGSVNLFSAGGVQSAPNVEILGDLVKVKSSDGSIDVATFDPFGVSSTVNSTLTIAQAVIGLNNGARAFGNGFYPANANNMKIENPNNGGGFNFAMKNPSGVERNIGFSRQGNIVLGNGVIGNGFPNGIGMSAQDGGQVSVSTVFDAGAGLSPSGAIQITTGTGVTLSTGVYDYDTDTGTNHELILNYDGTITLPQVDQTAATNYNFDASGSNIVTLATTATITFANFSGEILVNDLYDGYMYKFLCGSGSVWLLGSTNSNWDSPANNTNPGASWTLTGYASFEYTGGSYVFTNLATERDFSIFAIKTRNGA